MKISIGILAHNEENAIGRTLEGLGAQSLLRAPEHEIAVHCVPNGCTDRTAVIARDALERALGATEQGKLRWFVQELEEAGKARAWNTFVHELAGDDTDVFVLMDADIDLLDQRAIHALVERLLSEPEVHAVVGKPVKSIERKARKSPLERLSLAMSSVSAEGPAELNGGLYCARGILKRVWLPEGILVEDGFIRAMLITDLFTAPDNPARIVRVDEAVYEFDAYTKLADVFKHQKRLLVGVVLNSLIYDRLWNLKEGETAGDYASRKSCEDPDWLARMLGDYLRTRGWWVMPPGLFRHYLLKRARKLRHKTILKALLYLPVVLGGILFELPVVVAANRELRNRVLSW